MTDQSGWNFPVEPLADAEKENAELAKQYVDMKAYADCLEKKVGVLSAALKRIAESEEHPGDLIAQRALTEAGEVK